MKKRIIVGALGLLMVVALTGCFGGIGGLRPFRPEAETMPETVPEEDVSVPFEMERVGRDGMFELYRNTITDVLYVCFEGYKAGGLTVMVEPDSGLPLTYARFMEIYNQHSECVD